MSAIAPTLEVAERGGVCCAVIEPTASLFVPAPPTHDSRPLTLRARCSPDTRIELAIAASRCVRGDTLVVWRLKQGAIY